MNQQLWEKHLLERVAGLTRDVRQLRTKVRYERLRAETWKKRALGKTARK